MSLAKKSWKKAIALFLAVVMALSFVPNITARAAGETYVALSTANNGITPPEATADNSAYGTYVAAHTAVDSPDFYVVSRTGDEGSYTYTDNTSSLKEAVEVSVKFNDVEIPLDGNGANADFHVEASIENGAAGAIKASLRLEEAAPAGAYEVWVSYPGDTTYAAIESTKVIGAQTVGKRPITITTKEGYTQPANTTSIASDDSVALGTTGINYLEADADTLYGAISITAGLESGAELSYELDSNFNSSQNSYTAATDDEEAVVVNKYNYSIDLTTDDKGTVSGAGAETTIGGKTYTLVFDDDSATGFEEVKDNVAVYRLNSNVSSVKPLQNLKIYLDGTDVTNNFKTGGGAGDFNRSSGSATASVPDSYSVTLAAVTANADLEILVGDTVEVKYQLLGDNTSRENYIVDPTSIVADYKVTVEGGYPVCDTNGVLEGVEYYDADNASSIAPQVINGSTKINSADVIFYYVKQFKADGSTPTDEFKAFNTEMGEAADNTSWNAADLQNVLDSSKTDGSLVSALKKITTAKPTDIGSYYVIPVLKASADGKALATVLQPAYFEIAPVKLAVVPTAGQGKVYGEAEDDIKYTAYVAKYDYDYVEAGQTYDQWAANFASYDTKTAMTSKFYWKDGKVVTWADDDPDDDSDVTDDNTDKNGVKQYYSTTAKNRFEYLKTELKRIADQNTSTESAYGATKKENVLYNGTGKVDETKRPLLTRDRDGEEAGDDGSLDLPADDLFNERVGKYEIGAYHIADVDGATGTIVGNYDIDVKSGVTYEIKAKSLTGKTVEFFPEAASTATDPLKKATSETYTQDYGKSFTPGFIIKDNIKAPKTKIVSDNVVLDLDSTYRVQYENVSIAVGYRDSAIAANQSLDPLTSTYNFDTIEGEDMSDGAGSHTFTVTGTYNYKDSASGKWSISSSGLKYDIYTYAGTTTDMAKIITNGQAGYLDTTTVTFPYTGASYQIKVLEPTTGHKGTQESQVLAEDYPNEHPTVTFADLSDEYYTVEYDEDAAKNVLVKHPTDAEKKYSDRVPTFKNAGTYKVGYLVHSNTGKFDDTQGVITINIERAEFTYTVKTTDVQIEVNDPEYIIQKKAGVVNAAAGENTVQGKYQPADGTAEKNVVGDYLKLWYSVDEDDLASAGKNKALKAEPIDDERAEKIIEAAHKKAYENAINNTDTSNGRNLAVDYSDTNTGDDAINKVLAAAEVDTIDFTKVTSRSWDALTADQKKALMKTDLDNLKVETLVNKNYNVQVEAGNLTVTPATIPLSVYVHESNALSADKKTWLDKNVFTGAEGADITDPATNAASTWTTQSYNWAYGSYASTGGLVEVYVDRAGTKGNTTINGYYDAVDLKTALPEEIASGLTYRIYNNGALVSTIGKMGLVTEPELENALASLVAGTQYNIEVMLDPTYAGENVNYMSTKSYDDMTTVSGTPGSEVTTHHYVIVAPGQLKITKAVGGTIAISDTFAGVKDTVGEVIVMVNGGSTPINESDETYALWYAEDADFESAASAKTGFTGSALGGDLRTAPVDNTKWLAAKDFKFDTVGKNKIWVIAAPVTATQNSLKVSDAVSIEIDVKAQPAGENDIVADIIMSHTGDEGGKTITVGKAGGTTTTSDGTFSKTYGEYTYNTVNDNGTYVHADAENYVSDKKDNVATFTTGIKKYIIYELLSNNGYAVENQNTALYWGKNASGAVALYRYADMSKTALLPVGYNNYYTETDEYRSSDVASDGAITNTTQYKNTQDFKDAEISYNYDAVNLNYDVLDGGRYRVDSNGKKLLDGISITAKLIEDDNKILSYATSGSGDTMTEEPRIKVTGTDLSYTLAKDSKGGKAVIEVTVARSNFDVITFNVVVTVDADAPVVSIRNNDVSKDSSSTVNAKTSFTDKYVNKATDFSVTVEGAKEENGAFYYWSKEVMTAKNVADATKITQLMWQPLEGDTVSMPAEDGGYILYVKAVDDAGNVTYASSATAFTLDTKAPVISNSKDNSIVYTEELDNILLDKETDKALLKVTDASLKSVEAKLGEADAVELTLNAEKNYELTANEETYTIIATDAAGNITTAKIDVNLAVDNTSNDITLTYDGKDIDLTTLTDPADAAKKLFTISNNAGEASYSDATFEKDAEGTYKNNIAVRGEGTVKDGKLTVTKAGTFAIKLTTAKNKIYGETETIALLTVNKGTRQVSIKLVEDPAAETKVEKKEFSDTEALEIGRYADLIFDVDCARPADSIVTYTYYKKGSDTAEVNTPATAGDYEVSVAIAEDDLYYATDSLKATENKKAEYTVLGTNKIKVSTNIENAGTIKITDATGSELADINKVAKKTDVVITATANEGYKFTGWTVKSGVKLDDLTVAEIKASVNEDIELVANFAESIKITKQPQSATLYAEETTTLTVEATGNGEDDLTYQWQTKSKAETAFRNITGATAASYEVPAVKSTNDGDQYRVVITSKSTGDVRNSDVATITVAGMSLEGAVITLENDSVVYNGTTQAPKIVKVVLEDKEIASNDYTVSTDTYVDAKEYTVTITGAGDYTGTATAKYTIAPKPVTKDMFTAEDVNYTGEAVETTVTGKDGEKALVADKDFTVTYKNNTEVGTATAVVAGKGNYGGSVEIPFEVLGKSIKGATVSGLKTVAYTGKAITPAVTVKLDGKTLKKGTDYTVTYKNNKAVGTATVTITGKGDYSGTITKKFLIKKISFKYRAYVQKKNWMAWSTAKVSGTSASAIAGTTDNLRMETIQMQMTGVSGFVKYRAYVEKMGWTQWAQTNKTDTYAGTKGLKRRVEMIQLQTSGQVAALYDMYYRAYSEKFGWLGWAKSGEKAGSAGYALKLEAFQVNFVRKGETFSIKSDRTKCFYDKTKDGANPK